jgi:hypothetical protein
MEQKHMNGVLSVLFSVGRLLEGNLQRLAQPAGGILDSNFSKSVEVMAESRLLSFDQVFQKPFHILPPERHNQPLSSKSISSTLHHLMIVEFFK